ncbi:MAG: sortase [Caldilineaceae bacterium]|nr:sortase [Caldilineaceae bacterium]
MLSSFRIPSLTRIILLLLALGLLAGCGGRPNIFRGREPEEPAPPLSQPAFSHFDQRPHFPDRLIIPAIDLDTPVVELGWSATADPSGRVFSQWDVAEYAAGWHKNSAPLSVGGNVVMSGHNNILGSVFRELDQLREGDVATVTSGDIEYDYKINAVMIVPDKTATPEQRKENAKWIGGFDDDRLTLVSCWPRDDNTHRIIVVAHRVQNGEAGQATAKQAERN